MIYHKEITVESMTESRVRSDEVNTVKHLSVSVSWVNGDRGQSQESWALMDIAMPQKACGDQSSD